MFRWGKSSKTPGPAMAAAGEVAVHKVEKIDYVNLVNVKPPVRGSGGNVSWKAEPWMAAKKPESSGGDDINSRAGRFIEDTKNRWRMGLKSFRAGGR